MSKTKLGLLLLVVVTLIVALAACKPAPPKTNAASPAAQGPTGPVANAPFRMDLTIDPAQPNPNKDATFQVKLTDTSGAPVSGAAVTASLVMPSMDMGKNEFLLADKGNGVYSGTGKFTMSGDWRVVVTAKAAGKDATQRFDARSVMLPPK